MEACRTRGSRFKLKDINLQFDKREGILYCQGGEALKQVAQRSRRCPVPGTVQGQVG